MKSKSAGREKTSSVLPITEVEVTTPVALQQRSRSEQELEVNELWEANSRWALQQENAHYEPDSDVFDEAEQAMVLTPSEALAISDMKDEDLHRAIVNARSVSLKLCAKLQAHARQRSIPLCEEMRKRYARPGLKDRPFGLPTVEAYFTSIGWNYSTVRTWCAREKHGNREKLRTAFFLTPDYIPHSPMIEGDNTPYARTAPDFEKIQQLANKIVAIAQGHGFNLQPAATDLLIIAGRQFATKGKAFESLDPAAALGCRPRLIQGKKDTTSHKKAA